MNMNLCNTDAKSVDTLNEWHLTYCENGSVVALLVFVEKNIKDESVIMAKAYHAS